MSRADNQYEGSLFEYLVCQIHNKDNFYNIYEDKIPQERYISILEDAKIFCSTDILPSGYAEWTGKETSNQNGDLLINSHVIEIKYVSGGTGTYLNTSLEKISNYGFVSYRSYMETYGLYDKLEKYFSINRNNISPVDRETAETFKKEFPKEYKNLQSFEKPIRKIYVKDLFEFFQSNPLNLSRFIGDILSKAISRKESPEKLIVYNYINKKITQYDNETILKMAHSKTFRTAGVSLVFDNIRIAIGWQNCSPLNNPTLRCFIK